MKTGELVPYRHLDVSLLQTMLKTKKKLIKEKRKKICIRLVMTSWNQTCNLKKKNGIKNKEKIKERLRLNAARS